VNVPDTVLLVDLAIILETTVDNILNGGERLMNYNKKICVNDIKTGIDYLSRLGSLIGKDNTIYQGMVDGINNKMNINIEECLKDSYKREAMISEVIVQNIINGGYVDISDLKSNLEHEHWIDVVSNYANRFGIK